MSAGRSGASASRAMMTRPWPWPRARGHGRCLAKFLRNRITRTRGSFCWRPLRISKDRFRAPVVYEEDLVLVPARQRTGDLLIGGGRLSSSLSRGTRPQKPAAKAVLAIDLSIQHSIKRPAHRSQPAPAVLQSRNQTRRFCEPAGKKPAISLFPSQASLSK